MAGDIHFSKVALLLFGNAFLDYSYQQSPIHAGPITLSDAFPGVLNSSYWFKKTYTGLTMWADHPTAAAILADEDCCIEVIAFVQKNKAGSALFSNRTSGGNAEGLLIGIDTSGKAFARISASGQLRIAIDGAAVVNDGLHTFKLGRKSGLWGLSVDGVPQTDLRHQPRYTGEVPHGSKIYIGCDPYTTNFVGGVNAVRVTVGEAREMGAYTPSIEPWPIYGSEANILFGSLSSDITTAGAAVSITLNVENVETLQVTAVNGAGSAVGSDWAIAPNYIAGPNNYRITGTAPVPLADYSLVVTGTSPVDRGSLSRSQAYRLHNTISGALTTQQSLMEALGGAKLWLDGSDATTITTSGSDVLAVLNKVDSIPFTAAAARPKPTLDTSAMAHNSIRFVENASSGLVPAVPIVLSDSESDSTVVLVGKYVGQALGQGAGLFQISYTDDDARQDGTAAWVLATTATGVDSASAAMYDSTFRQNGIGTTADIDPGESFIIAWNTAENKADIWLQQRQVGEIEIAGTLDFWSAVNAAIGFIGGSRSPAGAFITMGELIALDIDLAQNGNESKLEQLISFLNNKWNVFPKVPFASTPTVLTGFVGNPFAAITIVTDATSVSISATAGSNWLISPTGSSVPGEYLITGLLPDSPTTVTLTIDSSNSGVLGSDDYAIAVQALPSTPTIGTLLNMQAQEGAGFASLVNIYSADTVSILASSGGDWAVVAAPLNEAGNYIVTGLAPDAVGSFTITLTASKTDPDTQLVLTTTRQFTIVVTPSLVAEQPQYQVDLTGVLLANKISDEKQTITPANGAQDQLIVPIFAPFFANSLTLQYYSPAGTRLDAVDGEDYVVVMKQDELSRLAQAEICSGIFFLNPNLRGTVMLNYQTLGGSFGVDRRSILAELASVAHDAQFRAWEAVTGKPVFFPVNDHALVVQNDLIGLAGLVDKLTALNANIGPLSEADVVALNSHENATNNPHATTKAHIGLPLVQNYSLASDSDAIAGTSSQRYLTPKTAVKAIDTHMPVAQDHTKGKFFLNQGDQVGDDTNNTKPLTGAGVVNLLISPTPNALNVLFASLINQAEQTAQATPTPLAYPLWWKGIQCANAQEFVSAVRSYTGLRALRFDSVKGVFYFPVDFTPPSLATTQSYNASGETGATVLAAVALPLTLTA